MIQKDYILRMYEMMAELIAAILGFIKKGELSKANQAIENAYYTLLREDSSFFREIPVEQLTDTLIQEHNYTNHHLEILAELFIAEAELQYAHKNYYNSSEMYEKSLVLLKFVEEVNKTFSVGKRDKLLNIERKLEELKKIR
ncbi:MAG: hypothetical protein U0W24_11325 [Bacteroidales bacterium]